VRDPILPPIEPTPRTHPRVGDTYTDRKGVTTVVGGPDANGNVCIKDPLGARYWTESWGFWSEGTYERRDPKHDPRVGDTKTYVYKGGSTSVYVAIGTDPFRYVYSADVEDENAATFGSSSWLCEGGATVVYACGDGS